MWDKLSVSTDRGLAAVEEWGSNDVVSVFAPVDVGLVALVAALFAESMFVGPCKVAVP